MPNNTFAHVVILLLVCGCLSAQPCSISISGGFCTGNTLTASFSQGTVSKLTWKKDNYDFFVADTISSPASVQIAAGGFGDGSAANQFGFPPGGISVDQYHNIYVADAENNRIQKWLPGAVAGITVAGGNGRGFAANQLNHPKDVFVDSAGNIYVADYGNARIQKWVPGAVDGVTVAGGNGAGNAANQLSAPNGVYVDMDGYIFIADRYNYRIQKWAPGATSGVTIAGGTNGPGISELQLPVDVYGDAAGNIYVADADADNADLHCIKKWAPNATTATVVAGRNGTGAAANQFGYITAVYADPNGDLYIADAGNRRVQKWAVGASFGTTVAGGHGFGYNLDQLNYATGVCIDAEKNVFVMDGGTYSVKEFTQHDGVLNNKLVPAMPGIYKAEVVFTSGCTATSDSIKVYSLPAVPSISPIRRGGRGNLCNGGIDTFYLNRWDDTTNYAWTLPPQCTLVADKGDSVVINVPQNFISGFLVASASNFCGNSVPDSIGLQGKPVRPFKIIGPRAVVANQTNVVYSVEDNNLLYKWSASKGVNIVSGQNTAAITVNWGTDAGEISVNASNGCGTSGWREKSVVVKNRALSREDDKVYKPLPDDNRAVFSISPNPAKDNATITVKQGNPGKYSFILVDMAGKILLVKEATLTKGTNMVNMDVSRLAKGIYAVNVVTNRGEKVTLRFAKL